DFAAVMDAYADDMVLALHGGARALSGGGGAVGKEAVGEWFGDWFSQFGSDYRFEIEEARDWGDRVFIVATHHGTGRASGAPVSLRAAWIYTLRDSKVVRCDAYSTAAEALEDAGVQE
ncbi:MAG: SnoaL-like polyketide cyclase, partial [Solirubrobacterales bacterium]|nr:SnoaL-like polyketide cyclase [Solirubrobacterales bacterium]